MASTAAAGANRDSGKHVRPTGWSHKVHPLTLGWLAISVPLVIWDSGYVLLRPHSMLGGQLHWIWAPYALYGAVDYNYGFKQWESGNGFTAAQTVMNLFETLLYATYLGMWWSERGRVGVLTGRKGAIAVLLAFSASVMTFSKTSLYFFNEACSGWENVRHNTTWDLIVLYLLPNGSWMIFPGIIICILWCDILHGLEGASRPPETKKNI